MACVLQWRRGWRREASPGGFRSAWERSPDDGAMRAVTVNVTVKKWNRVHVDFSCRVCVRGVCMCIPDAPNFSAHGGMFVVVLV